MWTSRNRGRYDRSKLRYPSDVTDEEWELIVPLITALLQILFSGMDTSQTIQIVLCLCFFPFFARLRSF